MKKLLALAAITALTLAWFSASESTRRYVVHIGKQVPALPYRYFI